MKKEYEVILNEKWISHRTAVYADVFADSEEEAIKIVKENPDEFLVDIINEYAEERLSSEVDNVVEVDDFDYDN